MTNEQTASPLLQKIVNWSSIIGAIASVLFMIYLYYIGALASQETLSTYIQKAGLWGPPLFIILQIMQTVVPIIPGALTSVAGVYIYGHLVGTIYNYIGIVIGCYILFYLTKTHGKRFVLAVVSQKQYDKYIGWLDKGKKFEYFFIAMMISPVSPADFLCMLAGLTKMSYKKYMTIIILTKPITLVAYTFGLTYLINLFWK